MDSRSRPPTSLTLEPPFFDHISPRRRQVTAQIDEVAVAEVDLEHTEAETLAGVEDEYLAVRPPRLRAGQVAVVATEPRPDGGRRRGQPVDSVSLRAPLTKAL